MNKPSKSKAEHVGSTWNWLPPKFESILQSAENDRRDAETLRALQFALAPFDAQAEHEADLRYESRVDYESWQYDGPAEMEDQ